MMWNISEVTFVSLSMPLFRIYVKFLFLLNVRWQSLKKMTDGHCLLLALLSPHGKIQDTIINRIFLIVTADAYMVAPDIKKARGFWVASVRKGRARMIRTSFQALQTEDGSLVRARSGCSETQALNITACHWISLMWYPTEPHSLLSPCPNNLLNLSAGNLRSRLWSRANRHYLSWCMQNGYLWISTAKWVQEQYSPRAPVH